MGFKMNDINISVTPYCDLKKKNNSLANVFVLSYNVYLQIQAILSIFRCAVK